MGCVNKSSKEFKNLSTRNNVDSNTLELITHKYWLEAGNETLFPTDVYIQTQLGNTHYQESGKSVRKLWEMRYNTPQEFKSLRELQVARKEASNFFPQSAIVHYRNAKGNYVLSVKRPVETVNYDKDSFFEELDNMGSVKDVKKLNLGIKENQTYTLDKVQQLYHRFNEDRTSKVLADKVFSIAKDLGLEVTFGETLPFGTIGKYTNNNTIIYKKSFLERDMMNSMKAPIILHEVLHALSMYALSNQTKNWKRSEDLEKFRTEMNSLYQDLKTNPILKGERGIVDVFEFVAELGNPVFRSKIQEIDKQNKDKKSFWSRVLDTFKTLLGLHTSNTYYQRSMNALEKALDAFDIDTYMRYNGIKNPLRKGYNEKEWDFRTLSEDELKKEIVHDFNKEVYNEELQALKNKAIANGTFMKAPNGKSTNLTEKQWLQIRTKAFKEWFGDWENNPKDASKAVDENGEPLVVYHYTDNENLSEFSTEFDNFFSKTGGTKNAIFFTTDNVVPGSEDNFLTSRKAKLSLFLNIKNLEVFHGTKEDLHKQGTSYREIVNKSSKRKGSENGIVLTGFDDNKKENQTIYVVHNPNQIKSATNNIGTFSKTNNNIADYAKTGEFVSTMSGKELKDELSIIEQENADYDLVNNIPEDNKHSGKAVPQDFTFADGTTVKAPFMPNAQQIDALNEMDRFMKSNETSMTLSGYAGTGKTSLMEMIAKKGQKQNRPVMFCATTNKAAAVLNDRVSKAGFKASTLNKVFGINVEVDSSKAYNARNLVNVLKDVDIMPGTTIIIDEASMINEENYEILNDIAKEHRLKIIYVGDEAQLAPVNEDKISKVFRNGEGKVIRLTQVERTDDNAILKEATAIRNGEPLSKVSSFNSKGEGVAYISPQHQDAINEVIDKYVKGLKQNPNYFRILAYTNKAVTAYNNQVRELLDYDSPIPHVGEPMTGYANWGYEWRTKSYRFINSESYKVTQVDRPTTVQTRLDNGTPVVMQAVPITLEDSLGNIDTFNFMDIKNNAQNRQSAMIIANEKKRLWNEARKAYGREAKAAVYAKINAIDSFLFVNDNIEDNSHNLLQAKTIDFGYALTIHKSQGSTFTHVLMDDVDVSRASMSGNNAANAMEMVDLGEESRNDAANAELKSSEEVDLGDLSDVEVENTQPDQAANIKQQLEYVGVSRATDTVTIISNNVKKEGSPLHLDKNIKDNTINSSNSRSENKKSKENGTEEYKATDEFRRVQEAVRKGSQGQRKSIYDGDLSTDQRQRLANVLRGQLGSIDSFIHGSSRTVTNQRKGTSFNIHSEVNPKLFHDMFEVVRYYTQNEELVDLHDDYSDAKCFLTEDGTAGFAIEPDGNLVSVFNLGTTKGFLSAIKDLARAEGANHLDAYVSSKENLQRIYEVTLGFHTAATMDYNMKYDHDDIAKNHDNPQVVFMVDHEVAEPKHFDKDSYDAAQQYQLSQLSKDVDGLYSEDGKSPLTIYRGYALMEDREAKTLGETVGKTAVDYDETLKGALYFTSNEEEATDYAKSRTDKSPEPPTAEHPEGNRINRHYTGDYAKVSKFHILSTAKVEHYKDIRDYIKNGRNTTADVIVLDKGTLWADNTEYIVKNPDVIVFDNNKGTETEVTNPSFPEGQTQKVSLPGYEYFNDLYDETPVDAAWKIPYLKELDAQLSTEHSFEENQNIINQMDTVLQATSEKEYLQESKDSQKKEVETNLSEYDKLNKQIDNLLNGDKDLEELGASLSATEVRHTAELIVNSISDEITNLQKEKGLAKTLFPSLNTDLDFQSASRKQIVETVGLDRLIERTKTLFSPQVMDYEDTDTMMQAQLITDNWDAIMYLAADIFAMNEGFGITKDYSRGNFTTTEDSKVDFDNFNDYSNDQDIAAEEGEKDEQEHWQVESRTIDVLNSMSALVRLGLHQCYLLDAEGNKVYSKWGIAERVNPRESVNSILRWTQGALSLDDMINRLSDKQKQNPWLSQLIERLSDKSGKETDFQSQFYGVFSKHFQLYSIVLLEDGKYYSMTVNSHPALSEAMKSISALFKIGEHPLFGNNGKINSNLLGSDQTTGKNSEFNLHKALTKLREIDKAIKEGKTLDDTMSKTATDNILGISKSFGYNITEEMLTDVVNAENIKKITESLGYIVKDLDKALQAQNKGTLKEYDPFKFGGESSIGGSLRNLLTPITDKLEDTAVNAFYDSGKMYQSYITPSFMTKLMNKFRQEGQAFEDFIMDEYGSSEWFKFQNGDVDKGWRNEWLRILAKDENARKVFDHKVELNFNKHNYMRNMSDAEYTLSLITEYFAESTDNKTNMVPAWFRVPMQLISHHQSSSSSTPIEVKDIRTPLSMVFIICSCRNLVESRLSE